MVILIAFFSFITAVMLFYPFVKLFAGKQRFIYRINNYTVLEEERKAAGKNTRNGLKAGLALISRGLGSIKLLDGYKRRTHKKLVRGHILLKAEEYLAICLSLFAAFALVAFLISRSAAPALLSGLIGGYIPQLAVKSRTNARLKKLNDQLGDAITLISNSLKAGYSFFQAADIVSSEMTGPISEEFAVMLREINLGITTEAALEKLAARVSNDNLDLLVTAVLIQRQTGGNLAEILDNICSTIRERVKIKGEIKTLTAQGRLSGLVISLLPLVLGVLIYLISPEQISLLFTTTAGIVIVIFSVFMQLIGILFIRKIVRIEV